MSLFFRQARTFFSSSFKQKETTKKSFFFGGGSLQQGSAGRKWVCNGCCNELISLDRLGRVLLLSAVLGQCCREEKHSGAFFFVCVCALCFFFGLFQNGDLPLWSSFETTRKTGGYPPKIATHPVVYGPFSQPARLSWYPWPPEGLRKILEPEAHANHWLQTDSGRRRLRAGPLAKTTAAEVRPFFSPYTDLGKPCRQVPIGFLIDCWTPRVLLVSLGATGMASQPGMVRWPPHTSVFEERKGRSANCSHPRIRSVCGPHALQDVRVHNLLFGGPFFLLHSPGKKKRRGVESLWPGSHFQPSQEMRNGELAPSTKRFPGRWVSHLGCRMAIREHTQYVLQKKSIFNEVLALSLRETSTS